jgi:hypothetical protein
MAGRIAYYGNIVRDGLVLDLDAAKRDSYPGSGTVWRDIAGGVVTGSLIGGPTFDPNNGGSIVFDGVDDYATGFGNASTFSFIQNTGIFTISSWARLTDFTTSRGLLGNNDGTTNQKGIHLNYDLTNARLALNLTYGVGGQATLIFRSNNFFSDIGSNYVYIVYSGDGINCRLYKNGVLQGTSLNYGTFSTGDSSREMGVGRVNNSGNPWQGNIPILQIYNRGLSAAEVLQNYNATKGRFGL